jgi:periplasmic nitrate reductase NapD
MSDNVLDSSRRAFFLRRSNSSSAPRISFTDASTDLHIASCVARIRPEAMDVAIIKIESVIGCPISARDSNGKVIVLIEDNSTGALLDQMEKIRAIAGVLNIEMVYQHAEEKSIMEEVIK